MRETLEDVRTCVLLADKGPSAANPRHIASPDMGRLPYSEGGQTFTNIRGLWKRFLSADSGKWGSEKLPRRCTEFLSLSRSQVQRSD